MAIHQRWKNIMKCYPFSEERLAKWAVPFIVQPKLDGVRCRVVPLSGASEEGCLLLSSEENVIFSVPHLNEIIGRSEERRVGKECTSWCRSRWSPYH